MSFWGFLYFISIGWIIELLKLIFGLVGIIIAGTMAIVVTVIAVVIFIAIIALIIALVFGKGKINVNFGKERRNDDFRDR